MTLFQEHELISTVADLLKKLSDVPQEVPQEAGQGLKLIGCNWLTPSQCYMLRTIIEEHNNRYYGNWEIDRELCERLKHGEHSA